MNYCNECVHYDKNNSSSGIGWCEFMKNWTMDDSTCKRFGEDDSDEERV